MTRTVLVALPVLFVIQTASAPPATLPARGVDGLAESLAAAAAHRTHVWRDTPPLDADGLIAGYIEIARGDRRKWEFDMAKHALALDRVIPEDPGGYPANYGFVPQTISYDGDPFDVLVLGDPIPGGTLVRGIAVGVLHMEDDKGLDTKVVISPADERGTPLHPLTADDRRRMAEYFARYKQHAPGQYSKVTGWGTADEGTAFVRTTHAFFRECRAARGPCTLPAPAR